LAKAGDHLMPLKRGKKNIGANIRELEKTGRPAEQAIAIAIKESRKRRRPRKHG
jgi:hypothetical protein